MQFLLDKIYITQDGKIRPEMDPVIDKVLIMNHSLTKSAPAEADAYPIENLLKSESIFLVRVWIRNFWWSIGDSKNYTFKKSSKEGRFRGINRLGNLLGNFLQFFNLF